MHDIPYAGFLNLLGVILLTLGCLGSDADTCRLDYYPQVTYRGEPTTIAVSTTPGMTVTIAMPGVKGKQTVTATQDRLELNLKIFQSGIVTIAGGNRSFSFHAMTPTIQTPIITRRGWLADADGRPVILLPEHRQPPPLDRRWETIRFLRRSVDDDRPRVSQVTIATGTWTTLSQQTQTPPNWRFLPMTSAISPSLLEIDQLIAGYPAILDGRNIPNQRQPEFLGLAFSTSDFGRGHRENAWRMKLEWLLQAVRHASPELPVFVASLPLDERFRRQWPAIDETLRIACQANGTLFVNGYFDRDTTTPITPTVFVEKVRPHLEKKVVVP